MNSESRKDLKTLGWLIGIFLALYHLPADAPRFQSAVMEAFKLARWYAREHVLMCLVPALFIAGAIGVFISQNAVMKYLGPKAPKWLSYSVASIAGGVLTVCSCTVLPLFGGIYLRGAGLGPAVTFLYSGPAINVLAIVLTARVLGWPLGVARAIGAVAFGVVIGLLMHLFFLREQRARATQALEMYPGDEKRDRPLWQVALFFFSLVGILVFANWGRPMETAGLWHAIFRVKWRITTLFAGLLGVCLWRVLKVRLAMIALAAAPSLALAIAFPGRPEIVFMAGAAGLVLLSFWGGAEMKDWRDQTWGFAKQILPWLFGGVLAAGFFLGSPESKDAGIVPHAWIQALVGDSPSALLSLLNSSGGGHEPDWLSLIWPVWTNLFASVVGVLMYFATLTEVPIVRGLVDSGMGQGPALALLLAGPALSLPSMLAIRSILGPKKALTFIGLVIVMATVTGVVFGAIVQ